MQPSAPQKSKTKLITSIVAIVIIAGIVLVADHLKSKHSDTASTATTSTSNATPTTTSNTNTATTDTSSSAPASSSSYKDGTYSASVNYSVPAGTENIKVSLTLQNGVVKASSITNSESDHDSAQYQEDFASSYKTSVIGKSLSGLKISNVSGASDTVAGFNKAVTKIVSEAQA